VCSSGGVHLESGVKTRDHSRDEAEAPSGSLRHASDTLANAADKAGIDEKTARKYRDSDALPSRMAAPHTWRTRLAFFTRRVRKHSLLGPFVVNRFVPRQLK
jgi:hypothetical protein